MSHVTAWTRCCYSASAIDACDSCFAPVVSVDPFKPPIKLHTCASCKRVKYCSKASILSSQDSGKELSSDNLRGANEPHGNVTTRMSAQCMYI